MNYNLTAAAEKRAARYRELGRVYKVPAKSVADVPGCSAYVIATASNGDTITIRVVARYGANQRKVTQVVAWTTESGSAEKTQVGLTKIASWFQGHAATTGPYLNRQQS